MVHAPVIGIVGRLAIVALGLVIVAGEAEAKKKGIFGAEILRQVTKPPPIQTAPQQTHCNPPAVYKNGKCVIPKQEVVCRPPAIKIKGRCIVPPKIVICVAPQVLSNGRCITPPPRVVHCNPPAVFSKRYNKCIIPQPEVVTCRPPQLYSPTLKRCFTPKQPTPTPVSCKWPTERKGSVCVCVSGYKPNGKGGCYQTKPPPPKVIIDVRHIQECLTVLNYNPGPIDGVQGPATRRAWRAFQQDNGLAARPAVLTDKITEGELYRICEQPPEILPPVEPPIQEIALPIDPPPQVSPIQPPSAGHCLPPDLYEMMLAEYGPRPGVVACTPQTAICLPKPNFYSEGKLASVAASTGISWCESCVSLNAWLPLETIFEIESAANITLCAAPPQLCYLPGRPIIQTQTNTEIRTIYKTLPVSVGNEGDLAVIIGNENYHDGLNPNVYGLADADAMVKLLTEQLGYQLENIIDLRDASYDDLIRVFGSDENPNGELAQRIATDQPGDVIVYASAHGMATEEGVGYLLPVDTDLASLETTAYPLQSLYANLGKAGARTVMLMLEATFDDQVSPEVEAPNIPELEVFAMPEQPIAGLAVFTAADRDQHTLEDPEYGIGLFTRYMIAGLAGEADLAPIGNQDTRIDTVELFVYTADKVRTAARKSFGLEQKPLLSKIDNLVVGQLAGQ